MKIETISAAADGHRNEDLIAVFRNDGVTDIIVMDGATSIADQNYIDRDAGDVVWFVNAFAKSLERVIRKDVAQEESVVQALTEVRREFLATTSATAIPTYALPIAAMTWIRVVESDGMQVLNLFCLGDCKAFLWSPDGRAVDLDPYENPQEGIIQREIARLTAEGVVVAEQRRERLMPLLRARREFQNSANAPTILCLEPQGPFSARRYSIHADSTSILLAMTDGFYRIVDTYDMHSIEGLAQRCLDKGLEWVLQELREYEAQRADAASTSVKAADDASAAIFMFR